MTRASHEQNPEVARALSGEDKKRLNEFLLEMIEIMKRAVSLRTGSQASRSVRFTLLLDSGSTPVTQGASDMQALTLDECDARGGQVICAGSGGVLHCGCQDPTTGTCYPLRDF